MLITPLIDDKGNCKMQHLYRHAGPLAIVTLCAACAVEPPTQTATDGASFQPTAQLLALTPGPHLYIQTRVSPSQEQVGTAQPAWIRITQTNSAPSIDLAISSGNTSMDQAALAWAADPKAFFAGPGEAPKTTMICATTGAACPLASPWKDGIALRSTIGIGTLLGSDTRDVMSTYNRAMHSGRIESNGRIVVDMTIDPSGKVVQCSIAQTTFTDARFIEDFLEAVRALDFGAANVARTRFTGVSFDFQSR